ncbi:MAG: phosphopantetheine-binding protein [Verrucomicrobiaceae bacterium]
MQTTEERVIRAISKIAKGKDVRVDCTFDELEIDSLSANEILFEIEDEFDIDIPDEGIRNIRGVRDVVRGVERLLAGETADFGGNKEETAS